MIEKKMPAVNEDEAAASPEGATGGMSEEQGETASIPLSMLGGQQVKEGDVLRLKVISVDTESGNVNVAYDHEPEGGGTDGMAAEFNNPPAADEGTPAAGTSPM